MAWFISGKSVGRFNVLVMALAIETRRLKQIEKDVKTPSDNLDTRYHAINDVAKKERNSYLRVAESDQYKYNSVG